MIDIFSVYRAPFRKDPRSHFIWDADNHMVADMGGPGAPSVLAGGVVSST